MGNCKRLHLSCLFLNVMVAVLHVISGHCERTTPGLANTYRRDLIFAAQPTAFGCKCNHTLFILNLLSVASSSHSIYFRSPHCSVNQSVVDVDVEHDHVGFIEQLQHVGESSGFCKLHLMQFGSHIHHLFGAFVFTQGIECKPPYGIRSIKHHVIVVLSVIVSVK
jgi:hypothetical protein